MIRNRLAESTTACTLLCLSPLFIGSKPDLHKSVHQFGIDCFTASSRGLGSPQDNQHRFRTIEPMWWMEVCPPACLVTVYFVNLSKWINFSMLLLPCRAAAAGACERCCSVLVMCAPVVAFGVIVFLERSNCGEAFLDVAYCVWLCIFDGNLQHCVKFAFHFDGV